MSTVSYCLTLTPVLTTTPDALLRVNCYDILLITWSLRNRRFEHCGKVVFGLCFSGVIRLYSNTNSCRVLHGCHPFRSILRSGLSVGGEAAARTALPVDPLHALGRSRCVQLLDPSCLYSRSLRSCLFYCFTYATDERCGTNVVQ